MNLVQVVTVSVKVEGVMQDRTSKVCEMFAIFPGFYATLAGGLAQMVERSLSMREVPGSMPGFSSLTFKLNESW